MKDAVCATMGRLNFGRASPGDRWWLEPNHAVFVARAAVAWDRSMTGVLLSTVNS